jgi:hypothetical protein
MNYPIGKRPGMVYDRDVRATLARAPAASLFSPLNEGEIGSRSWIESKTKRPQGRRFALPAASPDPKGSRNRKGARVYRSPCSLNYEARMVESILRNEFCPSRQFSGLRAGSRSCNSGLRPGPQAIPQGRKTQCKANARLEQPNAGTVDCFPVLVPFVFAIDQSEARRRILYHRQGSPLRSYNRTEEQSPGTPKSGVIFAGERACPDTWHVVRAGFSFAAAVNDGGESLSLTDI